MRNRSFFKETSWVSIILINLNFTAQSDNPTSCSIFLDAKKTPPKSVETTSVSNHRGCAGKMCSSRGRSLVVNLLEQNQQRPNSATNVRRCLATHGPSFARQSTGRCSKHKYQQQIKLQRRVSFAGKVKAWRAAAPAHVVCWWRTDFAPPSPCAASLRSTRSEPDWWKAWTLAPNSL